MKRINFREESKRLNVPVEYVAEIYENLLDERAIHGLIDITNEEFISFSSEEIKVLVDKLKSQSVLIKELAEEIGLKTDQMKLIINKLLSENKIDGMFIDNDTFVPYHIIKQKKEEYEKAIGKLTALLSRGEINESTYEMAVKSLEKDLGKIPHVSYDIEAKTKTSIKQITQQIFGKPTSSQVGLIILVIVCFASIIGGLWWYSLPKPATFTIVIESDTDWHGVIGSIEEGARSVSSSGYKSFKVWGTVVTAVVQKETVYGYLRVSIYRDGKVVASQETIASYGVVSVSAKT